MSRARKPQAELRPVYVRPELTPREREALRAWRCAAYSGQRHQPQPGTYDPLHLRQGLRACNVMSRAGWVVSNPLYDQTLVRHPQLDPSLPGDGWLREVYRDPRYRRLVMLPNTLAALQAKDNAVRAAAMPPAPITRPAEQPAQQELFA